MAIVDEDVVRVREATDVVQLVSQHLALKRVGQRWQGLCPFHQERTPSFSVNAELGLWHCFGCGASGDAITFVRDIEHTDFVGAVEYLANRAGITLRYSGRREGPDQKEKRALVEVMTKAVDWYHQQLLNGSDAGPARAYLRSRGIDGDVVRRFQLGWAPDSFDALARHLRVPDRLLTAETGTGLGFVNRVSRQQDFQRARLLFPIFDAQGDPVAFGGRKLPGTDGPKYKNSPETPLYRKSRVLYGLNWAKAHIVNADKVIVCEGYTDVIGFARAGLPIAVATCGTALTEEHVRTLRRFSRRLLLAFDPDAAGQAAAERVYAWERAHDLEVGVVGLPAGEDPADASERDPDGLRRAVEEAQPFLAFRIARVVADADLSTPEGRARAADDALRLVAEHPDQLVRDQYVLAIADRCHLDLAGVRARFEVLRRQPRAVRQDDAVGRLDGDGGTERLLSHGPLRDTPETEALRVAVHRPADMLPLITELVFSDATHLAVFRALREHDGDVTKAAAALGKGAGGDPDATALLARLVVEGADSSADDFASRLVEVAAGRALAEVEREARHSPDPLAYADLIGWVKRHLEELRRDGSAGAGASGQLVAWLTQRAGETA